MELLIAGGIALVGYNLSTTAPPRKAARKKKYAKVLGPTNEYFTPGNDTAELTRQHVARAQARWAAARDPAVTGVVTPHTHHATAMIPFFTSAKKQNTNDAVKQTRLETFTGTTDMGSSATGTYRSKREVEAMFSPSVSKARVTSSGSAGNPMYARADDRMDPGVMQNNVVPSEQVRVGPGVGVGVDVAAIDGFHPMYRILPKNVGEYKKNNLPGDVNHGKSAIPKATSDNGTPNVSINHHPGALVWDLRTRPAMPSRAAVLAATNDADPGQTYKKPRAKDGDPGRVGNPARKGPGVRFLAEDRLGYEVGRDHPDRNHSLPVMNLTGSGSGVGAFTYSEFDGSRFATQQREAAGGNGFLTAPTARPAPTAFVLSPTQRDLTMAGGYVGAPGAGTNARGSAVHHDDHAKRTLRETQNGSTLIGPLGAVKGGTLDNVWRYNRLGREAKESKKNGGTTGDWRALPSRVNVVKGSAPVRVSRVGARDVSDQAAMPNIPNKMFNADSGCKTAPSNKLQSENPRLDLGVAVEQLSGNPFAKSLWTSM